VPAAPLPLLDASRLRCGSACHRHPKLGWLGANDATGFVCVLVSRMAKELSTVPAQELDALMCGASGGQHQVPGGLSLEDLHAAAEILATRRVLGIEIGEFEVTPRSSDTLASPTALIEALEPLLHAASRT